MHSFARHRHGTAGKTSAKETKGLIGSGGWRYDLMESFLDTWLFRGQVRQLRQRTAALARIQSGDAVLDVGCGTGTLALEAARRVGRAGRVAGVDPGAEQIARARAKAARRHVSIEFQTGVIEQLPFPDQTFDVVLSTLMMHHLPNPLKQIWKRRRCSPRVSLLSQEQALSGRAKAKQLNRQMKSRTCKQPTGGHDHLDLARAFTYSMAMRVGHSRLRIADLDLISRGHLPR